MIDDRTRRAREYLLRGFQTFGANIGIANAVEDEIMGRQRRFAVVILGHQNRSLKCRFVEKRFSRRISAGRRNQQQDPDWRSIAPKGQHSQKLVGKS